MKISVSAVPYFWNKETYQYFYKNIALSSVDIVYLGETVCSKRRSMKLDDWLDIAELLTKSGKRVVLSTLTLIEAESELSYLTKIASQKNYLVEANDMSAIEIASLNNNKFVTGTAINVYNNRTFKRLMGLGMTRWVVPVELGKDDLTAMIAYAHQHKIEVEYQVFGRLPLAYSARCFTARHHQFAKDSCQFICSENEQGILVNTQEGDSFAQINGIQIQSAKVVNLIDHHQSLKDSGIDILRISPISLHDTLEIVSQLSNCLQTHTPIKFSSSQLENQYQYCNGYWFQIEGMSYIQ